MSGEDGNELEGILRENPKTLSPRARRGTMLVWRPGMAWRCLDGWHCTSMALPGTTCLVERCGFSFAGAGERKGRTVRGLYGENWGRPGRVWVDLLGSDWVDGVGQPGGWVEGWPLSTHSVGGRWAVAGGEGGERAQIGRGKGVGVKVREKVVVVLGRWCL